MTPPETSKGPDPVWTGRLKEAPDPINIAYCAGRDVVARPPADGALIPYDIWLNQAHALMLHQQGIIPQEAHTKIQAALKKIHREVKVGRFHLDPNLEDVHMNVERFVTDQCGEEVGGLLHTGRSRNDQSATDVRMFLRWHCLQTLSGLCDLVEGLCLRGEETLKYVMPGWSHTQPASFSTFAHLLCCHAQAILRDAQRLQNAYDFIDQSPLGAAAGFGTAWKIQRQSTARWLAFRRIQENSLDCISSRWEMETQLVTALSFFMTHLSMLSQDIIMLSGSALKFVRLPDAFVTGSSIMPQKRNPDFAEVTRAKCSVLQGMLQSLFGIAKGSISGYNRDSQWSKYLAMDAINESREAPYVFNQVVRGMGIDEKRMERESARHFINAVDLADFLSDQYNLTFRQAYRYVGVMVRECEPKGKFEYAICKRILKKDGIELDHSEKQWEAAMSPDRLLGRRKSYGGPAPSCVRDNLSSASDHLAEFRRWQKRQVDRIDQARQNLAEAIDQAIKKPA